MDTNLTIYPSKENYSCVTKHIDFENLLFSTSYHFVSILKTHLRLQELNNANNKALKRATKDLVQLPHEVNGEKKRWHNARWLSENYLIYRDKNEVSRGQGSPYSVVGEHPWKKEITKKIITDNVIPLLERGLSLETITPLISNILLARMQTAVILKAEENGINPNNWHQLNKGDGLIRYINIRLYDRKEGRFISQEEIVEINSSVAEKIARDLQEVNNS